ncbi:MAG: NUDIX hydrolase [Candidatus Kerfeldbacteria bacterium]|nr:NUDIX hydrolase [Candidatus Kerfeldbacteria bacterium]
MLMGRKDPIKGGVYSDCWHIPGGGVEGGQSFEEALKLEVREEVGIDVTPYTLEQLPYVDTGVAEKILKDTEETVLCHMEFHRFMIVIHDKIADEIKLQLGGDLVELQWFSMSELPSVKQIPGGREFFQKLGYITED